MKKLFISFTLSLFTLISSAQAEETTTDYYLTASDNSQLSASLTNKGWRFQIEKDKVTFIVVFGHKCPPCLAEIPSFIQAIEEHKDDLSIVAIEAQGLDNSELQIFKQERGINYTLLTRKNQQNEYFFSDLADKLNWKGELPFLVVLDKYGEVQGTQLGEVSHDKIESMIQSLKQ